MFSRESSIARAMNELPMLLGVPDPPFVPQPLGRRLNNVRFSLEGRSLTQIPQCRRFLLAARTHPSQIIVLSVARSKAAHTRSESARRINPSTTPARPNAAGNKGMRPEAIQFPSTESSGKASVSAYHLPLAARRSPQFAFHRTAG